MEQMNDWREKFENKFPHVGTDERDFDGQIVRNEIKAFISELLSAERKKVVEEAIKVFEDCPDCDEGFKKYHIQHTQGLLDSITHTPKE